MASGFIYKFDFSIRRTNGVYTMPASILMREIVKYEEGDGVTFLLDNDETVTLLSNYTGIGSKSFAKGYLFETSFTLSEEDVERLKNNKVTAVRITYLGGHYDRELKDKKQELIMNCLNLFPDFVDASPKMRHEFL